MGKTLGYFMISAIFAIVSVTGLACKEYKKSQIDLPNYNSSRAVSNIISTIHNEKRVQLKMYDYYNFDPAKLLLNEVSILYNEDAKPWLLLNIALNLHLGVASSRVSLYEYQNNKWNYVVTINNLTNGSITESVNDFVKNKYGLEFR